MGGGYWNWNSNENFPIKKKRTTNENYCTKNTCNREPCIAYLGYQ
jgi:hypothetical protein